MNLTSVETIKNLLAKYGVKPLKGLGQNFLIDNNVLQKVVEAAELSPKDTILEIGPGLGVLTRELAQKAGQVISIEKDGTMVNILNETLAGQSNITLKQENALTAKNDTLPKNYKVVANIPYYITSPLIRKFLETSVQPSVIVLMVQKEVAQRICSEPPRMSLLAVSVQFYANAQIISYVSKESFWPAPKVDSAIIKIIPHDTKREVDPDLFFKILKAGFMQPRKQLGGNLSRTLKKDRQQIVAWLQENSIDPQQRAQTLSVEDWVRLAQNLEYLNRDKN